MAQLSMRVILMNTALTLETSYHSVGIRDTYIFQLSYAAINASRSITFLSYYACPANDFRGLRKISHLLEDERNVLKKSARKEREIERM